MAPSRKKSPRRANSDREDPFAQIPAPADGEPEPLPGDVSEEIFWDIADSFIETANNHGSATPIETVGAALMYAASRYNAFLAVAQHTDDTHADSAARIDVDTTVDYFTLQFRKMLEDNLNQYIDTPDASHGARRADTDSDSETDSQ